MPVRNPRQAYYKYFSNHKLDTICCPMCDDEFSLSLKTFLDSHVSEHHRIDPKTKCPFCFGRVVFSSASKYSHLHTCLKKFVRDHKSDALPPPIEFPDIRSEIDEPIVQPTTPCPCIFYNTALDVDSSFRIDETWRANGFYDLDFQRPEWWVPHSDDPTFDAESGLLPTVTRILRQFDRFKFYHGMIRAYAHDRFLRAMEPIRSTFALLPYACLCNGTKHDTEENESDRHHKHVIVAARDPDLFQTAWKSIQIPHRSYVRKYITVDDILHLIHLICYVGGKRASCDGRRPTREMLFDVEYTGYHYMRFQRVYPHAKIALGVLVRGVLDHIVQHYNQNKNIGRWLEHVREHRDAGRLKYTVPVGATNISVRNCPIPFERDLVFDESGPIEIYLMGSRTLRLRREATPSDLERCAWLHRQPYKFLDAVYDEPYFLNHRQTSAYKDCLDMKRLLQTTFTREKTALQSQVAQLQSRIEQMEFERRNQTDRRELQFFSPIEEIRREKNEWQQRCRDLESDNQTKNQCIERLERDNQTKNGRIQELECDNQAKNGRIQELELALLSKNQLMERTFDEILRTRMHMFELQCRFPNRRNAVMMNAWNDIDLRICNINKMLSTSEQ